MNKDRRKEISRAISLLEEAQGILETCRDEESDYKDGLPENLQQSQRYYDSEVAYDNLESALSSLEEAISSAEEAKA